MNPEQLESVELDSEVDADPEVLEESEVEKVDKYFEAEAVVISAIDLNIFDQDLSDKLRIVTTNHFNTLREKPAYSSDVFQIIDLNNQLWQEFHKYESEIQENKISNVDLNELNRLLREIVLPKMNKELWDLTAHQTQ